MFKMLGKVAVPASPSGKEPRPEDRLELRLRALEDELVDTRRRLAIAEEGARSASIRVNAAVDLFEQRVDLIYRQIVNELGRTLAGGAISVETDDSVDLRLSKIFSAGLRVPVDPARIDIGALLSDDLRVGTLRAPLTIYGFRISREIARETGEAIEIGPATAGMTGAALFGPYRILAPGSYALRIGLAAGQSAGEPTGTLSFDIYSPSSDRVVSEISCEASRIPSVVELFFDWPDLPDLRVEIRCHQRSNVPLHLHEIGLTRG